MLNTLVRLALTGLALSVHVQPAAAQPILGVPDAAAGSGWNAGWMTFTAPYDFRKGEHLRLRLGGSASKVVVRLLPQSAYPSDPVGVVGVLKVPADRILNITLDRDYPKTIQVSIHAGEMAWSIPLGGNNGPATLEGIEIIKK